MENRVGLCFREQVQSRYNIHMEFYKRISVLHSDYRAELPEGGRRNLGLAVNYLQPSGFDSQHTECKK